MARTHRSRRETQRSAATTDVGRGARAPAPATTPSRRSADGRRGPRPEPTPPDPRDPDPARPELLGPRAGRPDGRRPRRPRGLPVATRSRASPTPSSASCRASRTTPAASAGAAASSPGSREGTWAGHIAEHIALELQNLAGTDVRHGKTRSTGEHGRYNVIYEFREEAVGIEAGKIAVALVNHLVAPNDPAVALDFMAELERLIRLAERSAFGPSTQAILDEARQPRHPVHPARPPLARPARPGRPPAADPGDDDLEDVGDRASTSRATRA